MKSKNALCSAIRQNHAAARGFFTSDFADCADGKPIISYPCHPRNPWFNFFGCDWPRCGLSIAVALQLGMLASSAQAQNLFVESGGNILEFTPGGAQSPFATGLSPYGLACDSAGNLFVADTGGGNIYEFTPGGARSTFASGLPYPIALAFNSAGNLFVTTYYGNIYEFTPGGAQSFFAGGLGMGGADALAFDSSSNLFVANSPAFPPGNIYEITPGGALSNFVSGLNRPAGLAFDSAGDLFEADYGSGNIYEFTNGVAAERHLCLRVEYSSSDWPLTARAICL